jgi:hypothetical protein
VEAHDIVGEELSHQHLLGCLQVQDYFCRKHILEYHVILEMVLGSLFLLSALESPTLHTYTWITIILQSATLNMKISFYN